jgi:S-DNA-T family DNA segregation ATPase FtsK/SpoIIIE
VANSTNANADSLLGSRLREGAFIGVTAVCLYLLMALVTYSTRDPGWSATGSGAPIDNLGGPTGAWLADVFFSLVGYAAYLFPLLLAYRAIVLLMQRREEKPFDWTTFGIRALGLVLVMIAGTALAALNDTGVSALPQGNGGILGQAIGSGFTTAFSGVGSRLILLAIFLFGITIFTDLSWLTLSERIGAWSISAFTLGREWATRMIAEFRESRQRERAVEARKLQITEHVEKEKKRPPPKIKPLKKTIEKSDRVEREKQQPLFEAPATGDLPRLELLDEQVKDPELGYSTEALEGLSKLLELKLLDFGVSAEVTAVYPGPVITRFEIQPAAGVKVSRISSLAKDIARSLAVISVRVVEVIPGKSVVGIEIPNEHREIVNFREVLASKAFEDSKSPLTLALGHDISGQPTVADLAKMPHLLVAGTTGSGKSVGLNSMLLSLLYKSGPADVRFILVDPKMLELSVYDGIPHLLTPVITDMKDAANGLRWCVAEMERRYKLMAALGVRNLAGYNRKIEEGRKTGNPITDPLWTPDAALETPESEQEPTQLEKLPNIVVVIDEFADYT